MSSHHCVGLVLAAGYGRRFGRDKRLARLAEGSSLLSTVLECACSIFDELYVVLRPEDDTVSLGVPPGVRIVRSPLSSQGMGHSLASGVSALLETQAEGVAVLLGDMPWISVETLQHLASLADKGRIILPCFNGQQGHPVVFGRSFWPELMEMSGDSGGRKVVSEHSEHCIKVAVDDSGVLRDVDEEEDLGA